MAGNKNPAVHSVSQLQTGQLHVLTGQGYAEVGPTGAVPLLDSIVWNLAASWSHQIKTSYPDRPLGMREVTHLRTTVYFLPDGFSQFVCLVPTSRATIVPHILTPSTAFLQVGLFAFGRECPNAWEDPFFLPKMKPAG